MFNVCINLVSKDLFAVNTVGVGYVVEVEDLDLDRCIAGDVVKEPALVFHPFARRVIPVFTAVCIFGSGNARADFDVVVSGYRRNEIQVDVCAIELCVGEVHLVILIRWGHLEISGRISAAIVFMAGQLDVVLSVNLGSVQVDLYCDLVTLTERLLPLSAQRRVFVRHRVGTVHRLAVLIDPANEIVALSSRNLGSI